ncbi:toll/interleukin-1 receptor domain-containing protein [Propionivibrio sp.]|uniref:toll/interleukin-1 receptor domain-containing protein n=1 Tax=Propionivibrio sp. TaxID=2212460 RepID=UPI0026030655|nr:toll/interleukin-1 receptor domain-containing protein [Propionivibrio sp.]
MSGLFISYRRDDQAGFAGRLADALGSAFGANNVFRDIDDIHPGEDFVAALTKQLHSIDVMLVVIGPGWLTARRNGIRRLDEPEDFVRQEIQVALDSGKAVLPVLVGGAAMPAEDDLPATIGALARRQAFILSDPGWSSDVTRLTESIKPLLPFQQRFSLRQRIAWVVTGIGLIALLATSLNAYRSESSADQLATEIASALNGRWTAQVNYDWGAVHQETFDLRLENGEIHGTASYLRVARSVEQGQLRAEHLSFITHSQEMMNDAPNLVITHRYRGMLKPGELHLVLESSGGQTTHTPVEFIARRVEK